MEITEKEYTELKNDQKKLRALEGAGVDNWDGYDMAMDYMDDQEEVPETTAQFASSSSGDWRAFYLNGDLQHQGHNIRDIDILDALNIKITKYAEMEYEPMLEHHGTRFPEKFSDIKPETCSDHTDKE